MLRSRILFVMALAAAGALAVGYEDTRAGFTLLYALVILCAICAVSALFAPTFLSFREGAARGVVFKDEVFTYTVAIRNRGPFLYPGAVYRFYNAQLMDLEGDAPLGLCEPLRGQEREYTVRFPYRGVYDMGLESVTITDMLGLFRRTIRNKQPLRVTVFPEQDQDFELTMRTEQQDAVPRQDIFNEDYSTVADLRKYTPADSLRKIHWKLSAKRGELIAKNFQSFEPDKTILLLDTLKIDLPERERAQFEDKMVSYAASAVDYFARGKMPASMVYGEPGLEEAKVDMFGGLDAFYALLAGIRFEREKSGVYEMRMVPGRYNMVAFLSALDLEMCNALLELVSLDHNLAVYLFYTEFITPEQEGLVEDLRGYGVSIIPINIGEERQPDANDGGAA